MPQLLDETIQQIREHLKAKHLDTERLTALTSLLETLLRDAQSQSDGLAVPSSLRSRWSRKTA